MPEGLKPQEVAHEMHRHKEHTEERSEHSEERSHDRVLSIVEAILLAVVAVLAAYTGFASAKWSTESSVKLATASAARTEANRADLQAMNLRNFDASTFNAWFSAYLANNPSAEQVAERRFRPEFKVAFDAWMATNPFTNASSPPGPTYMKEYKQPNLALAASLDAKAAHNYKLGVEAGSNSDEYVRDTIYLATILFLVGISGHFRFFRIRVGLVSLGAVMLVATIAIIIGSPPTP